MKKKHQNQGRGAQDEIPVIKTTKKMVKTPKHTHKNNKETPHQNQLNVTLLCLQDHELL